jgi:hypothetical protein
MLSVHPQLQENICISHFNEKHISGQPSPPLTDRCQKMLTQFNIQNPSAAAARKKAATQVSNPYAKRTLFQLTTSSSNNARAEIIRNVPSSTKYKLSYLRSMNTRFPTSKVYSPLLSSMQTHLKVMMIYFLDQSLCLWAEIG